MFVIVWFTLLYKYSKRLQVLEPVTNNVSKFKQVLWYWAVPCSAVNYLIRMIWLHKEIWWATWLGPCSNRLVIETLYYVNSSSNGSFWTLFIIEIHDDISMWTLSYRSVHFHLYLRLSPWNEYFPLLVSKQVSELLWTW